MGPGITGGIRPNNAYYIIECPKCKKLIGWRGEIHCLKRAFPGRGPILGECTARGGGDETNGQQQTDDFPVASHKINGSPCVFLGEYSGDKCSWGTLAMR